MDPGPIPLLSMSIYLVTSWRSSRLYGPGQSLGEIYSGAVIVIFLFLLMIMDSAQIDCVSDEDKSIYLVLALVHMFSINLL